MQTSSIDKILSSPHTHSASAVSAIMRQVLYALIPGILLNTYYFGIGILVHCLLAVLFALIAEAATLKLRKQDIAKTLNDGTAVVTAILFALTISPFTPWWVSFTGIAFAIVITKHLFGGIGHNPFNPAMAGYVFVYLCFPVEMAYWPALAGLGELELSTLQNISIIFTGIPNGIEMDAISGATALSRMKTELGLMTMVSEIKIEPLFGSLGGKGWEWIAFAYLAGGVWLLMKNIIRWQIPIAVLTSLFVVSLLFNMLDSEVYPSAIFHLFTGGTVLCAFFIATDPTSSSTTPRGKLIYGAGVGLLIYIIRSWGGYPDGIAFSILIMNALVPLIDFYTRPKILGEK